MKGFYFDVESDLAHFRDPMSHSFHNTFLAPPTHTIHGLLGACCGFSESECEDKLNNNILVGCNILTIRGYLKDISLMSNQKENKYIGFPRARKFIVNPRYRIYVAGNDIALIDNLRTGISFPKYTPYLGISDCLAYIRYISKLTDIKETKLKETDSIVCLGERRILNENDLKENQTPNKNSLNNDFVIPQFHTTIKNEESLTVNPELITVPRSYIITETDGRKPNSVEGLLVFSNCTISFKKPINGYIIDNQNVSLT